MCGVFGIFSKPGSNVLQTLLTGIKELEHRGYDSTGIALIDSLSKQMSFRKICGTVNLLKKAIENTPVITANIGIGHTRWATHGKPSTENAHPHVSSSVAIIHNGVIENFQEIKLLAESKGKHFTSETDSEVIAHLLSTHLKNGLSLKSAMEATQQMLIGQWAILAISSTEPDKIVGIKNGTPMVIGKTKKDEVIITSDVQTLSKFTDAFFAMEDGDCVIINNDGAQVFHSGKIVYRNESNIHLEHKIKSKAQPYREKLIEEINQQPESIKQTLEQFVLDQIIHMNIKVSQVQKIVIVGCGSSYYAAKLAKYWLESIPKIETAVNLASEFRYMNQITNQNTLFIFISQSGETADTLAALKHTKKHGGLTLSITNSHHSSISILSDFVLYTAAGIETSVASTKTFTTQLTVLQCITIYLAQLRNQDDITSLVYSLKQTVINAALAISMKQKQLDSCVEIINYSKNVIYMGRGESYCIALEGALKLRELAYINAFAISAGEMKHGTLAIVDHNTTIIVIIPSDKLFIKTLTNIQEVISRGSKVIAITDREGSHVLRDLCSIVIEMDCKYSHFSSSTYAIPLQIMAYKIAIAKGYDLDRPRNLAKSVTVE